MPDKIQLELGCGHHTAAGWLGIDKRKLPTVDIVWDLELIPYPIADESCMYIRAHYILEHLKPWLQYYIMDELWRIMLPGHTLDIAVPYAGSPADYSSPDHCAHFNEFTFHVYDPAFTIYEVYKPKPWHIIEGFPSWDTECCMVIMLEKMGVV